MLQLTSQHKLFITESRKNIISATNTSEDHDANESALANHIKCALCLSCSNQGGFLVAIIKPRVGTLVKEKSKKKQPVLLC